jgi:PAS domain S-box-containing protein
MNQSASLSQAAPLAQLSVPQLLDLLADGAYVTDLNRNILFWNRAAEKITGWTAAEVVGRNCHDNILAHTNKDGQGLCGRESCPLHRSMITGQASTAALVVYARHRGGGRNPVEVTVAPVRDAAGNVVGGIELFRDLTESVQDQIRAKTVQEMAVTCEVPLDERASFETCFRPCDLVGGDFYRIEQIDDARYAILVADAVGHGVSAALYTTLLRSLWDDHHDELSHPARFMQTLNKCVSTLVRDSGYFGTAVFVNYQPNTGALSCVRAGHPAPLLFRADGTVEHIGEANPALALFAHQPFNETVTQLAPGDTLLLFTDGATEIFDAQDRQLGAEGLAELVRQQRRRPPPACVFSLEQLGEQLLRYSNQIHLPDDLTMIEMRRLR